MIAPIALVLAWLAPAEKVTLTRVFRAGEKTTYAVRGSINQETRGGALNTWIPADFDLSYRFVQEVKKVKPDGVADIQYRRTEFVTTEGETFEAPPKTKTEKPKEVVILTVSPINEILGLKDITPKPAKKPVKKKGVVFARGAGMRRQVGAIIGPFISEIQRLALFVGPVTSSLDFNPKFSFDEVAVGDTWKRTVSYQPQKLKGGKGKQAVQRLDYVYTYAGEVDREGRKLRKVTATLDLDTDLADFLNQTFEVTSEDTGLKTIPMNFKASIEFFLDPKTGRTEYASATSAGGFRIVLADGDEVAEEMRFKGKTTMAPAAK